MRAPQSLGVLGRSFRHEGKMRYVRNMVLEHEEHDDRRQTYPKKPHFGVLGADDVDKHQVSQ